MNDTVKDIFILAVAGTLGATGAIVADDILNDAMTERTQKILSDLSDSTQPKFGDNNLTP